VEQHAQVVAMHPEVSTDLIFVTLLDKDAFQDAAVSLGHLIEDLPDLSLQLLCNHKPFHIGYGIGDFVGAGIVVDRSNFGIVIAILFPQDIRAHGVYVRSEAIGLADLARS
jgi:hypothetical protein